MAGPTPEAMDRVARAALAMVADGMRLGLGTGRAAEAFIRALGERVATGTEVRAVCTSIRSQTLAESLGIALGTLDDTPELDVAFDGADEVTPQLDLTKGLGGALLRERVVAAAAARFVVLVTPDKLVPKLASRTHIPIEVVPFAKAPVAAALSRLAGAAVIRSQDGAAYLTDNGNLILDTTFAPLDDAAALDQQIRRIPGVVDTGLFLAMASVVLVGYDDHVETLSR